MKGRIIRALSIILVITTVFTATVVPASAAKDVETKTISSEYCEKLEKAYNEGYTPLTTQTFLGLLGKINDTFEVVLGIRIVNEEKMKITVDGYLADVFDGMKQASDGVLNCFDIVNALPQTNNLAKKVTEIFNLDTDEISSAFGKKADEFYAQGKTLSGWIMSFMRVYMKIYDEFMISSQPSKDGDSVYDIVLTIVFIDGSSESMATGVKFDAQTKQLYGGDGTGILGLGYAYDLESNVIYTVINSWQRNMGFLLFYDIFCYCTKLFDYVTKRIDLVYDNKEWRFQIWKGNYLIAPGGEIGIYTREIGSKGTFYNCASDDEMMVMGVELYHKDDFIFEIEPKLHWWITGFAIRPKIYVPSTLTIKGTIEFPDEEMASLFVDSANKAGVKSSAEGILVSYSW